MHTVCPRCHKYVEASKFCSECGLSFVTPWEEPASVRPTPSVPQPAQPSQPAHAALPIAAYALGVVGWLLVFVMTGQHADAATLATSLQNSTVTFLYASGLSLVVFLNNRMRHSSTDFARVISIAFVVVWAAQAMMVVGKYAGAESAIKERASANAALAAEAQVIFGKCPELNPNAPQFQNDLATKVVERRDQLVAARRAPAMALDQAVSEIVPTCNARAAPNPFDRFDPSTARPLPAPTAPIATVIHNGTNDKRPAKPKRSACNYQAAMNDAEIAACAN